MKVTIATSKQYDGEVVYRIHPNLRSFTELKFIAPNLDLLTSNCDFVFTAVPHGSAVKIVPDIVKTGLKIVDMSADFRLQSVEAYQHWYHYEHPYPEMLPTTPLGIPEIYRDKIQKSNLVANPGCMAITSILALAPLAKSGMIDLNHIVVDSKIGSSGGGTKPSIATHHAERYGVIRPYKPVDHRHTAEIEQEISKFAGRQVKVSMTPHAVNMVRGILCTIHTFGKEKARNTVSLEGAKRFLQGLQVHPVCKGQEGSREISRSQDTLWIELLRHWV